MKVSWCITPSTRDGDPAPMLLEPENNKEDIALRAFLKSMGAKIPRESLPQPKENYYNDDHDLDCCQG